ncbi:hypothetical protein [Histophilus somni]|uniref:hypothetical protein n=1 Tax=Histophilus somni TaxID=731 RepID=UPI0000397596|nr:hypothetical protein [Histophilus somni]
MKLKTLAMSALLAFGLVACNDAKDYSGTYTQINNPKISFIFEKGKNGDYQATFATILGKNSLTGIVKNGVFYRTSDNEKVGEFKENQFIDTSGSLYKK